MKILIDNINEALIELKDFQIKNNLSENEWSTKTVFKVLILFKDKLDKNETLNIRLLRAMKDLYVVSFRNFEGTDLYRRINSIDNQLTTLFPNYKKLEPLGLDFGKENPI